MNNMNMNSSKDCANKSIECTVTSCANHCTKGNYCALDRIVVGSHSKDPDKLASTDCRSFVDRAR